MRPGAAVLNREPDGVIDVENDDDEEDGADDPKESPEVAQMLRVAVDPSRPEEDLEIPEEVPDDEENQDHSGHRHNHLPADR